MAITKVEVELNSYYFFEGIETSGPDWTLDEDATMAKFRAEYEARLVRAYPDAEVTVGWLPDNEIGNTRTRVWSNAGEGLDQWAASGLRYDEEAAAKRDIQEIGEAVWADADCYETIEEQNEVVF